VVSFEAAARFPSDDCSGQYWPKLCSLRGGLDEGYGAAVGLSDRADNGQAEASARAVAVSAAPARKPVEYPLPVCLRYSWTGVAHPEV
jgi:hypothetical protein